MVEPRGCGGGIKEGLSRDDRAGLSRPMPPLPSPGVQKPKMEERSSWKRIPQRETFGYAWPVRRQEELSGSRFPARPAIHLAKSSGDFELAFYDEAQRILLSLVKGGRNDLELRLADLYLEKAGVTGKSRTFPGLNCFDSAIEILRKAMASQSSHRNALRLATASRPKPVRFRWLAKFGPRHSWLTKRLIFRSLCIGDKDDPS